MWMSCVCPQRPSLSRSLSANYGSLLDPFVSLYDVKGHKLASSDDSKGAAESSLSFTAPTEGDFLISFTDSHDHGGALFGYLLNIRCE